MAVLGAGASGTLSAGRDPARDKGERSSGVRRSPRQPHPSPPHPRRSAVPVHSFYGLAAGPRAGALRCHAAVLSAAVSLCGCVARYSFGNRTDQGRGGLRQDVLRRAPSERRPVVVARHRRLRVQECQAGVPRMSQALPIRDALEGEEVPPPLSRAPNLCPATVSLTASARRL